MVTSNRPGAPLVPLALGLGLLASLPACRDGGTAAALPLADIQPLALAFGPVPVGLEVKLPVRVRNNGKVELRVDGVTSDSASFRVVTAPASVASGESASFDVVFAPTTVGAFGGTLTIRSNADDNPAGTVTLDGQGIDRLVCTACDAPPPNYCTPGNSLVIYEQFGSCVSGKCQYRANQVACGGACNVALSQCGPAVDAGSPDAGPVDSGIPDAGPFDTGTTDAGSGDAGPSTASYSAPGVDTWLVPAGVTSVTVQAWGGGGGGGNQTGATGGGGGFIRATLAVTPGETLQVWVAEGGQAPGNGAGASFVLRGTTRLVVAAGGGGGGSDGCSGCSSGGGRGGAGGGLVGENGANFIGAIAPYCTAAVGGAGGTVSSGGVGGTATSGAGTFTCAGQAGSSSTGGRASGVNNSCDTGPGATDWHQGGGQGNGGGGGGGAGSFGGGGAGFIWTYCAGGGGGGASYADGSATQVTHTAGAAQAQGNAAASAGAGLGGALNANGHDGRVTLAW